MLMTLGLIQGYCRMMILPREKWFVLGDARSLEAVARAARAGEGR
jgi:hypothetical protein